MGKHRSMSEAVSLSIKANALYSKGISKRKISTQLNVSRFLVDKWIKVYKSEKIQGLIDLKKGMSKLTIGQVSKILKIIQDDAAKYGYEDNIWTNIRIKKLIKEMFNIEYELSSIRSLLQQHGVDLGNDLTRKTLRQVLMLLKYGRPADYGYRSVFWTPEIAVELTKKLYGRQYNKEYLVYYMSKHGFSFWRHIKGLPQKEKKTAK